MKDMFPSLPTATEISCFAFAKARRASDLFGDMKSRWDEGYDFIIFDGYRMSGCRLFFSKNASGRFGDLNGRRDEGYVYLIPTGYRTSVCGLCFSNKCFGQFRGTEE
jgi:hypothetical protein